MEVKRIDTYTDDRFSKAAQCQHGCFVADDMPFEIEIISDCEAIIKGENATLYQQIIDEFRFYTPHITRFVDENGQLVSCFPEVKLINIEMEQIQPSQFYVDEDKLSAISTFIKKPQDIIIPVLPYNGRYIALDGHTRLYYAVMKKWKSIRAIVETSDDVICEFVNEAQKRKIYVPEDMVLIGHNEYKEKWYRFCDELFAESKE